MNNQMYNLTVNDNCAPPQQSPRLPGIRELLGQPPAVSSAFGRNQFAEIHEASPHYAPRPPPIFIQSGHYSGPPSLASSPCMTPLSSDTSGSVSSGSRHSSIGPSINAPTNRQQRSKRGSDSPGHGAERVTKRSTAKSAHGNTRNKTESERSHRKEQQDVHANGEDLLECAFGYEVPTAQSASNAKKASIKGDKYQGMLAVLIVAEDIMKDHILLLLETKGSAAISQWRREKCERLDAALLQDNPGLPEDSWLRDGFGHDSGNNCEEMMARGKCSHDGHAHIHMRKERRLANWTGNFEQCLIRGNVPFGRADLCAPSGFTRLQRSKRRKRR